MADAENLNEAQGGVPVGGAEQVETTQAAPVAEQTGAGEAVQAEASGIKVGNQTFKTQSELAKAYEELQSGFTRSTQKYSEQVKAYQAYDEYLKSLGPEGRKAMLEFVNQRRGGQATAAPTAPQAPAQAQPADDRLERIALETSAKVEFMEFRQSHPTLTVEELGKVADVVEQYEKRGVDLPMEAAYRIAYFEQAQAKAQSDGQRKAEDAIKSSRNATSVAPNAASSGAHQGKPPAKFSTSAPLEEQREVMRRYAKEFGIPYSD